MARDVAASAAAAFFAPFAAFVAAAFLAVAGAISAAAFAAAASAAAVHVAVVEFFLRRLAHIEDLHVKVEDFTRERVVGIDGDLIAGDIDHRDDLGAFLAVGFELHAGRHFDIVAEILLGNLEHEVFIAFPVCVDGRNHAGDSIAGLLAFQVLFQARYDIVIAMEVDERFASVGRIQELSRGVTETIVNSDDLVFLDIHFLSFRAVIPARAAIRMLWQPAWPIIFIL